MEERIRLLMDIARAAYKRTKDPWWLVQIKFLEKQAAIDGR